MKVPFMIEVCVHNKLIRLCDEMIAEGSEYLKGYRHYLLLKLLRLQLKEFNKNLMQCNIK